MHTPREPHLTALKRSCATSTAPSTTDSYSDHPRRQSSSSTPTLTGLAALTRASSHPVMPCSWTPTSSPRPPSDSPSSLAPAERPCTASWPTVWQRPPGYASCSTAHVSAPPSSNATTSARSTSPPILCSISARSTWRSTYTSSASVSLPVTFGFSASPPRCSSPTSPQRGYRRVYS
jgi:hypothetical protein